MFHLYNACRRRARVYAPFVYIATESYAKGRRCVCIIGANPFHKLLFQGLLGRSETFMSIHCSDKTAACCQACSCTSFGTKSQVLSCCNNAEFF